MGGKKQHLDIFLSHSSGDNVFCDNLYNLLQEKAGFNVWYDNKSLVPGCDLRNVIAAAIEKSNNIIVVWSKNSQESDWVNDEINNALNSKKNVIPICIDDSKPKGFLKNKKWIEVSGGTMTSSYFFLILSAIYGTTDNVEDDKDVYVSYSWRQDRDKVQKIFSLLNSYRLIGDYPNQDTTDEVRIKNIMGTCRGFIGVLTYRSYDKEDDAKKNRNTSKYFLREIDWATECGLPGILIADSQVNTDGLPYPVFTVDNWEMLDTDKFDSFIESNLSLIESPKTPHLFYARGLNSERDEINDMIKRLCGSVTAIPCKDGYGLGQDVQKAIIDRIKKSYIMIADVSGDSVNTYIETGIALGADVRLFLFKQGGKKSEFLIKDIEIKEYNSDCELLAKIHNEVQKFRRKVLN